MMYKPGDIVWADLGSSYGWWPATVSEEMPQPKSSFGNVQCDHKPAEPKEPEKTDKNEEAKSETSVVKKDSKPLQEVQNGEKERERSPPRKRARRACREQEEPVKKSTDARDSEKEDASTKEMINVRVHFFDDDKHECYTMTDPDRLCLYTDKKQKLKLIKAGLKKFEAKPSKESMFDYRARQAQFYKDVEMAEVMTDNSIKVANLLAQYTVVDDAGN